MIDPTAAVLELAHRHRLQHGRLPDLVLLPGAPDPLPLADGVALLAAGWLAWDQLSRLWALAQIAPEV